MLLSLGALVLLGALQLDPALTPQRAPKPAVPKIDRNACPFEGCQFGTWRARKSVQLFSTWKLHRSPLAKVAKGDTVTAITGIHITFEPAEILVTAPMAEYGLKPGDRVFGYMNYGEGYFSAWFNGYWVEQFDGSGIEYPNGSGCTRKCTGKVLKQGQTEWWIQIKTKDGTTGWTKDVGFDGMDALAYLQSGSCGCNAADNSLARLLT
jgi:hypothetical protein